MKRLYALLLCLFVCLQTLPASAEAYFAPGFTETQVPFQMVDNRILIQVSINNAEPLTFVFDTGGSNILSPQAARALHLETEEGEHIQGAGEVLVTARETRVGKYKIGDLTMTNQNFMVLDLTAIQKAVGFERLDGIVGSEVLNHPETPSAYQTHILTFT